ncbi:MAG: hypothetical protein P8099_00005, partial [Gemmatimonadota bacterium]
MDAELEARFDQLAELIAWSFEAQNERFDRLETRMDRLESRMDGLESRMAVLERRVDAMDLKFEEKFLGVYERLDSERAAREQFERRVKDRLEAMGREIGDLRQVVVRLDARVDGLREDVTRLDARMDRLEGRMDRLESRMDRLEGRMDRLEGRMDSLESRMDSLEQRVDAMDAKFEDRFLGVHERLDSERAAREQFERRVTDRLDAMARDMAD